MVDRREVQLIIIAKLDRLTRSVRDLGELLERFQKRGVALVSVGESLDTGSAAGRLVLNVMASVSQWEREAIGERTRDALRHCATNGRRDNALVTCLLVMPSGRMGRRWWAILLRRRCSIRSIGCVAVSNLSVPSPRS
jgi:DNA invertase Pin-like site-specific DNA recombinase